MGGSRDRERLQNLASRSKSIKEPRPTRFYLLNPFFVHFDISTRWLTIGRLAMAAEVSNSIQHRRRLPGRTT